MITRSLELLYPKSRGFPHSLLLRRDRVLRWAAARHPGRVLEIGPGAAEGFQSYGLGMYGIGFVCRRARFGYVNADRPQVELHSSRDTVDPASYDVVIACEVLEHLEEDQSAFEEWSRYLKEGVLIISVPAHMKRWDATEIGPAMCGVMSRISCAHRGAFELQLGQDGVLWFSA